MSRHELVDAYIAQIISRREFVQGLTALVVSAGVAAAYAVALQPVAAGDGPSQSCLDLYPPSTQPELYELYSNGGGSGSGGTGDSGSSDDGGKKKKKKRKKKKKK